MNDVMFVGLQTKRDDAGGRVIFAVAVDHNSVRYYPGHFYLMGEGSVMLKDQCITLKPFKTETEESKSP